MKFEKKSVFRVLLYAVLYAVVTALVCITGSIHPVFFVCYQITAGILLSGIIITAFRKTKAPGVAVCLLFGLLLLLLLIQDAVAWHVIPLIVITVLAELIRAAFKYSWTGDVIATILMTFSSFGYYGQIWFNRTYTYECAIEERMMLEGSICSDTVAVNGELALNDIVLSRRGRGGFIKGLAHGSSE